MKIRIATLSLAWCAVAGCGRIGFDFAGADQTAEPGPVPYDDAGLNELEAGAPDADRRRDGDGDVREGDADVREPEGDSGNDFVDPEPDAGQQQLSICDVQSGVLACSTFRRGLPDDWFRNESSGDVDIDNGQFSGRVSGTDAFARVGVEFPSQTSGSIYFRLIMRAQFSVEPVSLLAFGEAGERGAIEGVQLTMGEDRAFDVVSAANQVASGSDAVVLPRGEWACLDGEVKVDDSVGSVRVRLNENEVLFAENLDTLPGSGIGEVVIGPAWQTGIAGTGQMLADQVVVATEPVECGL